MQINAILILAAATLGLAQTDCEYQSSSYASLCVQGDTVYCASTPTQVCDVTRTATFDDTANLANENACVGYSLRDSCVQTALCCK